MSAKSEGAGRRVDGPVRELVDRVGRRLGAADDVGKSRPGRERGAADVLGVGVEGLLVAGLGGGQGATLRS